MILQNIIGIVAFICAVWVIYEVWVNNKKASTLKKVVWTVCAIFFSIVTAAVYYFIEKK